MSVALSVAFFAGCSVRPEFFGATGSGTETGAPEMVERTEWFAYESGDLRPGHPEIRENVLEDDPSRGIGLKQANSMGGGPAPILTPERFRVFLFMGQSNMTGHGRAGKLEAPYDQPHPRIRIWAKDSWQYLIPRRNFGPEVSFAHEIVKDFPGETIGIIKVAVAGTGMNAWKPDWEWSEASKTGDALKGSLYRDMIQAVRKAHLVSDFRLGGFIWKQGGRDGRKVELARSYQDRFVELVQNVRSDLACPDLPVFVLTYFSETGIYENREVLERVRPNALPLYMSKARISEYLENAYPVFHGLLPTTIDRVHFDTEGQLQLGKITAAAVRDYYRRYGPEWPEQPSASKGKIVEPSLPE